MNRTLRGVLRGSSLLSGSLPLLALGLMMVLPLLIVEATVRRRSHGAVAPR